MTSYFVEGCGILLACVMGWLLYLGMTEAFRPQGCCPPYDKDEIDSLRKSRGELPRETFRQ